MKTQQRILNLQELKSMPEWEFNKLFLGWRNNVFCRRDSNQIKSRKLWLKINQRINSSDIKSFQIEWSHFIMGEFDANVFSLYFDKHVKKYYKISDYENRTNIKRSCKFNKFK